MLKKESSNLLLVSKCTAHITSGNNIVHEETRLLQDTVVRGSYVFLTVLVCQKWMSGSDSKYTEHKRSEKYSLKVVSVTIKGQWSGYVRTSVS